LVVDLPLKKGCRGDRYFDEDMRCLGVERSSTRRVGKISMGRIRVTTYCLELAGLQYEIGAKSPYRKKGGGAKVFLFSFYAAAVQNCADFQKIKYCIYEMQLFLCCTAHKWWSCTYNV
jgi:hypothetical protein